MQRTIAYNVQSKTHGIIPRRRPSGIPVTIERTSLTMPTRLTKNPSVHDRQKNIETIRTPAVRSIIKIISHVYFLRILTLGSVFVSVDGFMVFCCILITSNQCANDARISFRGGIMPKCVSTDTITPAKTIVRAICRLVFTNRYTVAATIREKPKLQSLTSSKFPK